MRPDTWHLIAAIKAMHNELTCMRKDLERLRDDVKAYGAGGGGTHFQLFFNHAPPPPSEHGEEEGEESESELSVESAPATVSYERASD